MSNFVHNDWSEIENLVLKRKFTKPDIINIETFKQDLINCITKSEAKENEFYKAFNIKRPSIKNGMFTKSDFFKYIQDDADNKWEQIFTYLSSTVFINNIIDGTANAVSFRMKAIAQQKLARDERIRASKKEISEGEYKGKKNRITYINDQYQHYTVNFVPSTEKFSSRTSVFQVSKGKADKIYEIFYGKDRYIQGVPIPGSEYVSSTAVRKYVNEESIDSIVRTINEALGEQVEKINNQNEDNNKISIDKVKINKKDKNKFVKGLAKALKEELEQQDSTKGFEMTYVTDNFDINISGGSYFQIVFKRDLVLNNSIAPIDKILLNRTEKQLSFAEEAEYISETLIKNILIPEFQTYMDKTNFCPTPNKRDVLGETIGSDDFKNSLKSTILEDFNNKNSDNNLTFDKYINSLFGKTIIQESGMTEKTFLDQIQARKSKVQGTLGELLLAALLKMKAEAINNNGITVSILGQDKNLLGQQSHTDIIVNINGIKIGIQAKQYNSNKFENKQTFYDEEVNVFGGKFIRYIAENSNEKDSLSRNSKIILNYLRYLAVANNTTVDVSKYLSQYYTRFSRIEDVFEDIGGEESGTFNNFISYNFGMIPMSLILQDILDEINSLEKIFILNPISVDKKDKNKEIACYILEDTNPFTIRYKTKTSKDNQNNNDNENDDEEDNTGNTGKLMRGMLNFVGISVHVSKIRK